jgi:hypothetical protein
MSTFCSHSRAPEHKHAVRGHPRKLCVGNSMLHDDRLGRTMTARRQERVLVGGKGKVSDQDQAKGATLRHIGNQVVPSHL